MDCVTKKPVVVSAGVQTSNTNNDQTQVHINCVQYVSNTHMYYGTRTPQQFVIHKTKQDNLYQHETKSKITQTRNNKQSQKERRTIISTTSPRT